MAQISVDRSHVKITLSAFEKISGFLGDLEVPRSAVQTVSVVENGFRALRGMRAPGLGMPFVRAIGTWRGRGYKDFVSVSRGPALVLELAGQKFARAIVTVRDPEAVAAALS
ncbi:MAG: hypothetical protein LLG14_02985 [Nocardiaceae bacterium]|nr:hypothetical protein [Nocardiaceae bacterium]